jgi:DNA-binding transcriptional LysR family regulator
LARYGPGGADFGIALQHYPGQGLDVSNAFDATLPYTGRMALEIRQMRHVLALAELGSFARAASVLHLSQSALSRSIQVIEQQVGAALFLRSAAGVVPTDIGRVLAQRARQVVQMAEEIEQEVLSNRTLQTGQLCVGTGPYPIETIITPALTRFISTHPLISIRLQLADWDMLLPRLRAREMDFFVAEISTLQREPDLIVEPMSAHALYFVGRRDHPLARRTGVKPGDTFAFPFAAPARIPPRLLAPMLSAKTQAADATSLARPFPTIECNVVSAVKRVVEGSDALTALTLSCMATELQDRRLTLIGSEPWMTVHYGVVSLKDRPMSSAAARLREFVFAAEAALTLEEEVLLARWRADGLRERRTPRSHKASTQVPR